MAPWTVFPDKQITAEGIICDHFIELGIDLFHGACDFIQRLPYGYNSDRDDLLILFKEQMGTCTTKHARAIATVKTAQ